MELFTESIHKNKNILLAVLLISAFTFAASPVKRLDMFDEQDNHLMFVNFEYDTNGNHISRSVYMSDSTFKRKTIFENDAQGNRIKETSLDFNYDTILTTTLGNDGGKTSFSIIDQFGNDQLGGAVSYSESGEGNYDIFQGSSIINKMVYDSDAQGKVTKISVLDKDGLILYYAKVTYEEVGNIGVFGGKTGLAPAILTKGSKYLELHFHLSTPARVECDLFSLSGRRVAILLNKRFAKGVYRETVRVASTVPVLAAGVYLVNLSINGKIVTRGKYILYNSRGGI